jgi:hypothetical protein
LCRAALGDRIPRIRGVPASQIRVVSRDGGAAQPPRIGKVPDESADI